MPSIVMSLLLLLLTVDVGAQSRPANELQPNDETKTIVDQQRQILSILNDIKQLLAAAVRPAPGPQPPQPLSALSTLDEAFRGASDASVAIVEYADFECPYCGQYERDIYPQISRDYIETGKVKYFFRDLPLPMHPHAMQAARAAHCAGEQGKYWEMHDSLFGRQNALSDPALVDRAQTLDLDVNKFTECFSGRRYTEDIQKSMSEAQRIGIDGTPTFFIGTVEANGDVVKIAKRIGGAAPYQVFKSVLDALLAPKSPDEAGSTH